MTSPTPRMRFPTATWRNASSPLSVPTCEPFSAAKNMATAPRLRGTARLASPSTWRLNRGAHSTTISIAMNPTTIEVAQESPTIAPARRGSLSRCSATKRVAVIPMPVVNRLVNRLVVESTMAISPNSAAPSSRAQPMLLSMVNPLANPAPRIDQTAPTAIRLRRDGSRLRTALTVARIMERGFQYIQGEERQSYLTARAAWIGEQTEQPFGAGLAKERWSTFHCAGQYVQASADAHAERRM